MMPEAEKAIIDEMRKELSKLAKEVMDAHQALADYYKSHSDQNGYPQITSKTPTETKPLRERIRVAEEKFHEKVFENLHLLRR